MFGCKFINFCCGDIIHEGLRVKTKIMPESIVRWTRQHQSSLVPFKSHKINHCCDHFYHVYFLFLTHFVLQLDFVHQ